MAILTKIFTNNSEVTIDTSNYLYKVVDFLRINWAFIQPIDNTTQKCKVVFVNNASTVFDEMIFASTDDTYTQLKKNGFGNDNDYFANYMGKEAPTPPIKPYYKKNNPIYSSGEYWKN